MRSDQVNIYYPDISYILSTVMRLYKLYSLSSQLTFSNKKSDDSTYLLLYTTYNSKHNRIRICHNITILYGQRLRNDSERLRRRLNPLVLNHIIIYYHDYGVTCECVLNNYLILFCFIVFFFFFTGLRVPQYQHYRYWCL